VSGERIARVEALVVVIPRETPYLGALRAGDAPNPRGYVVRRGNRTVYPIDDRTVLVRIETASGAIGWGEGFGVVAPRATAEVVVDLLGPLLLGRDPRDPAPLHDDLADTMRVRGFRGGFFGDALAAVDIAVWDLAARLAGLPLARLLGGLRHDRVPAYVSGLPKPTLAERVAEAEQWIARGFDAVKFAAVVADAGPEAEMAALRAALGPGVRIAADLHWAYTAADAIAVIDRLARHGLWFAEAPVASEDIDGLAAVAARSRVPIAGGEELATVHDVRERLARRGFAIVQPEMGHTGITQFLRIAHLAEACHVRIIPHATIGIGLFLAASLHASAALAGVIGHEYQHSIMDRNLRFLDQQGMACATGAYTLPEGPGLGVTPSAALDPYIRFRQAA
jgi:galactonate dehydratase